MTASHSLPYLGSLPQELESVFNCPVMSVDDRETELVTFVNVSDTHTTGKDVAVRYRVAHHIKVSRTDWVGIFRSSELEAGQPLAFQWAQGSTSTRKKPKLREITFPADVFTALRHPTDTFQYVYVSQSGQKMGVSTRFSVKPGVGRTSQQSKFREPGSSASLFVVSSDDEWDFGCEKDDISSSSDFSDIVVLSTSPSKEAFKSRTVPSSPEDTCCSSSAGFIITPRVNPVAVSDHLDAIPTKPYETDILSTSPDNKTSTSCTSSKSKKKKSKKKTRPPPDSSSEPEDMTSSVATQNKTVHLSAFVKNDIENESLRSKLNIVDVVGNISSSDTSRVGKTETATKQVKNERNQKAKKSLIEVLHTENFHSRGESKESDTDVIITNKDTEDQKIHENIRNTKQKGVKKVTDNKFQVLENLDTSSCEPLDERNGTEVKNPDCVSEKNSKKQFKHCYVNNKKHKGNNNVFKETSWSISKTGHTKGTGAESKINNTIHDTCQVAKADAKKQGSNAIDIQKSSTFATNEIFPNSKNGQKGTFEMDMKKKDLVIREGSPAKSSTNCLLEQTLGTVNDAGHAAKDYDKKCKERVKKKNRILTEKSSPNDNVQKQVDDVSVVTAEQRRGSKKIFLLPGEELESIREKYKHRPGAVSTRRKRAQKKQGKTYNLQGLFEQMSVLEESDVDRILLESVEATDAESCIDSESLWDTSPDGFPTLPAHKGLNSLVDPSTRDKAGPAGHENAKSNERSSTTSKKKLTPVKQTLPETGLPSLTQDVLDIMKLLPEPKAGTEARELKEWQRDVVPNLEKGALRHFKAKYRANIKSKGSEIKRHKMKKVSLTPTVLYTMVKGSRDAPVDSQMKQDGAEKSESAHVKASDVTIPKVPTTVVNDWATITKQTSPVPKSYACIVRSSIGKKDEAKNSADDSIQVNVLSTDCQIISETHSKLTSPLVQQPLPKPIADFGFCIGTYECKYKANKADELKEKLAKRLKKRALKLQKSKDVAKRKRSISKARDLKAQSTAFESRSNEDARTPETKPIIHKTDQLFVPAWLTKYLETSKRTKETDFRLSWPMPSTVTKSILPTGARLECGSVVASLNIPKTLQPSPYCLANRAVNVWRCEEDHRPKVELRDIPVDLTVFGGRAAIRDHAITLGEKEETTLDKKCPTKIKTLTRPSCAKFGKDGILKRPKLKAQKKNKTKQIGVPSLESVAMRVEMSSLRSEIQDHGRSMSLMKSEMNSLKTALDEETKRVASLCSTILELQHKLEAAQMASLNKPEVVGNDAQPDDENHAVPDNHQSTTVWEEPPCKKRRVTKTPGPEMQQSVLAPPPYSKCCDGTKEGHASCHYKPANRTPIDHFSNSVIEGCSSIVNLLKEKVGQFAGSHMQNLMSGACVNPDFVQTIPRSSCEDKPNTKREHPFMFDAGDTKPTCKPISQKQIHTPRHQCFEQASQLFNQHTLCGVSMSNTKQENTTSNHLKSHQVYTSLDPKTNGEYSSLSSKLADTSANTKCSCRSCYNNGIENSFKTSSKIRPSNCGIPKQPVRFDSSTTTRKESPCLYSKCDDIPLTCASTNLSKTLRKHPLDLPRQGFPRPSQNELRLQSEQSHNSKPSRCCNCGCVVDISPAKSGKGHCPNYSNNVVIGEQNNDEERDRRYYAEIHKTNFCHPNVRGCSSSQNIEQHKNTYPEDKVSDEHCGSNILRPDGLFCHFGSVNEVDDYCSKIKQDITLMKNLLATELPRAKKAEDPNDYVVENDTTTHRRRHHVNLDRTYPEYQDITNVHGLLGTIDNSRKLADTCSQTGNRKAHNVKPCCCCCSCCGSVSSNNLFTSRLIKDKAAYYKLTK